MSRWLSRGSTRLKRFPSSPDRGGFRSGLAVRRNRNKSRNSSFLDWPDRLREEKDCQHHQMTGVTLPSTATAWLARRLDIIWHLAACVSKARTAVMAFLDEMIAKEYRTLYT